MVSIRRIERICDFEKLPAIQQDAWGFCDRDLEPYQLMTRVQKYGGLVLGLFLDQRLIGFNYSLLGKWRQEYFLYSHMLAIERRFQGRGLGFRLKKQQRREALRMGYRLIRWSFDPLEALNAYFNIHRLGAVSNEYERNIYGEGGSGLHRHLPTDRLIALWRLDSPRITSRLRRKKPPLLEAPPADRVGRFSGASAYVEIPRDIRSLKQGDINQARAWRLQTRRQFETGFARGFSARDVVQTPDGRRIFFKLTTRADE